jgi:sodium/potassium-transporting ATPase subunit alpha
MLPEECSILRDSRPITIPGAQVVPGDIVHIKAGNKLPADVRLIQASSDAKFDRSVLTGESRPVPASVDCTDANYLETHNIGLQGTHCIMGTCIGIVVATGDKTVFGRIAKLTNEPRTGMTTLGKEILYFVVIICSIMLTMVLIVIIVWAAYLRKEHPDFIDVPTLIVNCVSVAIAFIPEGLPIALTAGLTITANLMRKNKVLCKTLNTVETLGSVSVVCSDKTGTLTTGKMTVTECLIGGTTNMSIDEAAKQATTMGTAVAQLRALSALCNAAELDYSSKLPAAQKPILGDATDTAILRFAEQLEENITPFIRSCWTKTYELAFNSKNKFMIRTFTTARAEGVPQALPQDQVASFGEDQM